MGLSANRVFPIPIGCNWEICQPFSDGPIIYCWLIFIPMKYPKLPAYINAATEVNPITNHRELGFMKLAIPLWLGWCIQYALYGLLWLVTGIVYGIGVTSLLTQTHHIQYVWVVLLIFFPITISYPMNINEPDCWLLKQTKQTQHIQSLFPTKPHQSIVIVLWIVLFVSWLCSMISMMNSHSPTRNRNGTYWESLALIIHVYFFYY